MYHKEKIEIAKRNGKTGEVKFNRSYLISEFSKEELEQILVGRVVTFWTKDCTIMPDFRITAPVMSVGYFSNGEISIRIRKKKAGRSSSYMDLSSKMHNLKFILQSD